jgi:glycine/D-amino acid oxidase-like deaminating enzyme/nitrite reductase/ring-hydroxylating ferredoxin subunit
MRDRSDIAASGTQPLWTAGTVLPELSGTLPRGARADVIVVGAGIAGITTAYRLARAGLDVIVVDARGLGSGETGRTTAHLATALDDRYHRLEQMHGAEGARLAADSHAAAIDWIEDTVRAEGIHCDFVRLDGYLFLAPGDHRDQLVQELEAARRAGVQDIELLPQLPLRTLDPGPALRFGRQGQLHPVKYLAGLARAFLRAGGRIHADAHVETIEGGERARIGTTDGRTAHARHVVVATNTPVNNRVTIHTKQAAYRSYVIGIEVPRGAVPVALYWDTADPYHYVRLAGVQPAPGMDLLVVGGEDHKTGQDEHPTDRWTRLEAWAMARFPQASGVRFHWSGQIMEPADALAYIGRNPHDHENVYIATGDSGHGMTHGTIAGLLIGDLVLGRDNPWATLYDPRRLSLRALGTALRENMNTAAQYADWVSTDQVEHVDQIALGQGAVVRRGLRRVAVYRDLDGDLHAMSAACPHLGGVVQWNAAERTWDCPCHGSRFDPCGRLLNGPAIKDLEPARDDVEVQGVPALVEEAPLP